MKNSYSYLKELCELPPSFTAQHPRVDPRTPRVHYLIRALEEIGLTYEVDMFAASGREDNGASIPRFVNLLACVPASSATATANILLMAHHDIANPDVQNANDNSASCANLLALAGQLRAKPLLDRTVWFAWTDAEEICSMYRSGARRIAKQIADGMFGEVAFTLNLELTAYGTAVYTDQHIPSVAAVVSLAVINTPFNDATVLRHWGVKSCAVLGTLPTHELDTMLQNKVARCTTWSRCHRTNDQLCHARGRDMAQFVHLLYRIIRHSDLAHLK